MRAKRLWFAVLCLAAGQGCGSNSEDDVPDATPPPVIDAGPDAPPPQNLDCLHDQAPATVPDPIVLTFHIVDEQGEGLAGAPIEVRQVSDDSVLVSGTTNASGKVTIMVPTGGQALQAYSHYAPSGYVPGNVFYFGGLTRSQPGGYDTSAIGASYDPTSATFSMSAIDCESAPAVGVKVSLSPFEEVYYYNASGQYQASLQATSSAGFAYGYDARPGTYEVSLHFGYGVVATATMKLFAGENSYIASP